MTHKAAQVQLADATAQASMMRTDGKLASPGRESQWIAAELRESARSPQVPRKPKAGWL